MSGNMMASSLLARQAEQDYALRSQSRQNAREADLAAEKGSAALWQGEKDEINISAAARMLFDQHKNAATPLGNESPTATMSAVTRMGSTVTLEARASSNPQFSLARFGERDAAPMFSMSSQKAKGPELEYVLSVASANGELSQYTLTGNTRLSEDKAGNIRILETGAESLRGDDGQDILINLDGADVDGGGGDDIIFNLAEHARLNGGDGNDVLFSMGNGVSMDGGTGDDALIAMHDTLRTFTEDRRLNEKGESYVVGRPRNHQQLNIQGGDGNDAILAQTGLYQSSVGGGAGMDDIDLGEVLESTIDGGDGSDTMRLGKLTKSSVLGGAGDDTIELLGKMVQSEVFGGDGDDNITAREEILDSTISGGSGSDQIELFGSELRGSVVRGDGGDDLIHTTGKVIESEINGGAGDDFMWLQGPVIGDGTGSTKINAHEGNDTIYLGQGSRGAIVDGGTGSTNVYLPHDGTIVRGEKTTQHLAPREPRTLGRV